MFSKMMMWLTQRTDSILSGLLGKTGTFTAVSVLRFLKSGLTDIRDAAITD